MSYCDDINCGYYYKGEDDDYPCCHCEDGDIAPCECDEPADADDDCEDDPFHENDPYVVTHPMAFY